MFEGKYTGIGSRSTLHPRVANRDLGRHLGADSEDPELILLT